MKYWTLLCLLIHVFQITYTCNCICKRYFFLDWEDSIKTSSNNVNEGPTDNNVDGSQTKGNFLKDVNSLFEFFFVCVTTSSRNTLAICCGITRICDGLIFVDSVGTHKHKYIFVIIIKKLRVFFFQFVHYI